MRLFLVFLLTMAGCQNNSSNDSAPESEGGVVSANDSDEVYEIIVDPSDANDRTLEVNGPLGGTVIDTSGVTSTDVVALYLTLRSINPAEIEIEVDADDFTGSLALLLPASLLDSFTPAASSWTDLNFESRALSEESFLPYSVSEYSDEKPKLLLTGPTVFRLKTSAETTTTTLPPTSPSTPTSLTFNYTGTDQTWVVPAGVSNISVKMWGAAGGSDADTNQEGGGGGYASDTSLAVTAGETLKIVVGGGGENITGGWPSGGDGGSGSGLAAGGGGGRSGVYRGAGYSSPLIVAGGGGGASDSLAFTDTLHHPGGAGGGATAEDGAGPGGSRHGAGGQTVNISTCAAGDGGDGTGGTDGSPGSLNTGGDGNVNEDSGDGSAGGGGGDGHCGGGGGAGYDDNFNAGAGGGGAGFTDGIDSILTAGVGAMPGNAGDSDRAGAGQGALGDGSDGIVVITYTP